MDASRRELLKDLLEQALDLAPDDRADFLEQVKRDYPDLADELAGALFPGPSNEEPPRPLASPPDDLVGTTIHQYLIQEKIGGGGMGVVYRALDTKLDRPVALKFLPPYLSTHEEAKRRFIQEAEAASSLDHTHIGYIHEIDESGDGRLFTAMAYYSDARWDSKQVGRKFDTEGVRCNPGWQSLIGTPAYSSVWSVALLLSSTKQSLIPNPVDLLEDGEDGKDGELGA